MTSTGQESTGSAAQVPEYFATSASVAANTFAIIFDFLTSRPESPGGDLRDYPALRLHMSPQLAKALLPLIAGAVANYESSLGPIPVDPTTAEQLRQLVAAQTDQSEE